MKRRAFLSMFGAAAVAPALPAMAAPAAQAGYSRYMYGLAVFHARTRPHVSARGLAHVLKVSAPQAEAMIAEMASKGLVKPLLGGATGHVRAVSNILKPDIWGISPSMRRARSQARRDRQQTSQHEVILQNPLLAHLHKICRNHGLTLSPRCATTMADWA